MHLTTKYDDIIDRPHPVSDRHAPMPLADRAAQFAPFAALTGYGAAICETGRLTADAIELTDSSIQTINRQLAYLSEQTDGQITVTWFEPDPRKDGGSYKTRSDFFKKIDPYRQLLLLKDGTAIPLDAVIRIDCPAWEAMQL